MSEKKETLDPEIWTLSVIGDVYGFIDEAFRISQLQSKTH